MLTVHKPEKYTYAEAAALPMSALVAYAAVNVSYIWIWYTGLSTKDETSETTGRILFGLFP